jgi:hypothetical protein
MTTAEINAYLDWRAQREGRQVDVSPEAYHRDCIVEEILQLLDTIRKAAPEDNVLGFVDQMVDAYSELDELEKEN